MNHLETSTGSFRFWRTVLLAILAIGAVRVYQQHAQKERDLREGWFIQACVLGCPDRPDGRIEPSCAQKCERLRQLAFP